MEANLAKFLAQKKGGALVGYWLVERSERPLLGENWFIMQVIRNCCLFKIARLLTGVCYDSHRVVAAQRAKRPGRSGREESSSAAVDDFACEHRGRFTRAPSRTTITRLLKTFSATLRMRCGVFLNEVHYSDTLKLGSAYNLERFRLEHDFSAEVHCGTEQSN
jgi:hypothetical protein